MATTVAAGPVDPEPFGPPGVKIPRRSPTGPHRTLASTQDGRVRGTRRRRGRVLLVAITVLFGLGCGPAQATVPDPDPGGECDPYADPRRAAATLSADRALLKAYFAAADAPVAWALFDAYLTPGTATAERTEITDPDVLTAFATHPATSRATSRLLKKVAVDLAADPPVLTSSTPVAVPAGLGVDVDIGWHGVRGYPGILAGGTSGTRSAAGRWQDRRDLTGAYRLVPTADADGVLTRVQLVGRLRLRVLDAVDFCPGFTGRVPVLTDLSRLERTGHPDGGPVPAGGATFARPLLFGLTVDLDPVSLDVTDRFPGNDADADGRPDRQPWRGARYALDRCPRTAATSCPGG